LILELTYDLDPIQAQGQGHGAFELPTTSEAMHAGGDDRSPLAGLSGSENQLTKCSFVQLKQYIKANRDHAFFCLNQDFSPSLL